MQGYIADLAHDWGSAFSDMQRWLNEPSTLLHAVYVIQNNDTECVMA